MQWTLCRSVGASHYASASPLTGGRPRQSTGFASLSPTAAAEFRTITLVASSNRSLPPKEKTGLGLACGLLAGSQIGLAVPSECGAEYILTMAALVFQSSFQTVRIRNCCLREVSLVAFLVSITGPLKAIVFFLGRIAGVEPFLPTRPRRARRNDWQSAQPTKSAIDVLPIQIRALVRHPSH